MEFVVQSVPFIVQGLYPAPHQHSLRQGQVCVDEAGVAVAYPVHQFSGGRVHQLVVGTRGGEGSGIRGDELELRGWSRRVAGPRG